VAQTRKRRRRKHRGTQGGRVDARRGGRPRSRQEARDRARANRRAPRAERPPTWRGAINRGLIASAIFIVLLLLVFRRPAGESIAFGAFMLAFYIPMGYYIDRIMWRRRQRLKMKER
jgi:hypothetical protein